MSDTPTAGKSGSHNSHSRLSPSGSKRWINCNAAPAFEAANEERVFRNAVNSVIKLTPYLLTFPDELADAEKRAIKWVRELTPEEMTEDQKKDVWRTASNKYAREGSRAHDFASDILNGEKMLMDIPEEFQHPVGIYVDHCFELMSDPEAMIYIEESVPLFYAPDDQGTVDFASVTPERVRIRDLKYGRGDLVNAEENTQLAIYAMSFVAHLEGIGLIQFDPDTLIDIGIVQPRHHAEAPVRPWVITLKELREFVYHIDMAVDQIKGGDVEFNPSDEACKYCACKAFCPARQAAATSLLDGPDFRGVDLLAELPDLPDGMPAKEFKKLEPVDRVVTRLDHALNEMQADPVVLDDQILVRLYGNIGTIEKWLADIREYLDERVLAGEKIEGLKIVMGREGNRQWADEEAADKLISGKLKAEQRYTKKLISPTQAEELLDLENQSTRFKNSFKGLVHRSSARKTVTTADDKRPEVVSDVDELPEIEDD